MSISFRLDVDWSPDSGEPLSGFEMGDMYITGAMGSVSSAGRTPDQSMMVFLSLTMLLDGLSRCLTGKMRGFQFGAVDSSFGLEFHMLPKNRVRVSSSGTTVDEIPITELVRGVGDFALDVFAQWGRLLPANDVARRDLEQSIQNFERFRDSGGY